MLDYRRLFSKFSIPPRGVVHIGAWHGEEESLYREMGFKNRLFVEAQPDTFQRLKKNLRWTGALCENLALSDKNGKANLHVTSNGQSTSLLELKKHITVYPEIVEQDVIEVTTMTLDSLLEKEEYRSLEFNFLNIDIQGAELLCFLGAVRTLPAIDAINCEVNFDELYQGCPYVQDIDAFLNKYDFVRADTTLLYHRTWGDAFYVKKNLARA